MEQTTRADNLAKTAASLRPDTGGIVKFFKDCLSGTVGGIAVVAVGHPFDTIKVRLQTQPTANPIYSGAFDCLKKTLQWEGVGGLYKGVASPLAGQMFFRATLFSAFGESKRWLGRNSDGSERKLQTIDYYKAGMMTGFVAAFTEAPIDFYKSQIQVQIIRMKADPTYKAPYTTVVDCVKSTIATSGFKGPFQGLGATILRNTPANAIYLGSFEVMKQKIASYKGCEVKDLSAPVVVGAGGFGGILYWLAIYPVDVIKSAMMTDSIIPAERKYPTMLSSAKKLWAEGGLSRFYRGFSPCLLRAAPANGVMLYTVDQMQQILNK
jgi:solute carrier family 25 carnitine/acylcarnitine transporter 20/29